MKAAVESGDAKKVAALIRQDPGFNVNMEVNRIGFTLLHVACFEDSRSAVIPLLLAHPDIDANSSDRFGRTPFNLACEYGHTSGVREMLKDSRVKVNEPNDDGRTPLFWAAWGGHFDVIRWWIASGRETDFGKPGDVDKTDVIGVEKERSRMEVVTLLERFQSDTAKTRHAVRVELGWYDDLAAKMFALVVFVSDGLLEIKDTTSSPAVRFFTIATQLPLEL